ncbi:UvrD-helicase domain-containing protein [Listeria aquatica]|uniref:UvrD-helicase domain-containing protein n=1 Tax=Listeria aquatica TaxID=1494960 RepID=UPI0031F4E9DA
MTISKNRIKLACAGSGKTWGICNDVKNIDPKFGKKILLVTYTNSGVESIISEYKKQNNGVLDQNVEVITWYQFLLRELIKPYQSFFVNEINILESIDYDNQYRLQFHKKGTKSYFLTNTNDVKVNNVSEFAVHLNKLSQGAVIRRLEEIYCAIYIDELQDLVGRDIDLLELLLASSIHLYCVGDYKQSTLKTHNAKANGKKAGRHIFDYLKSIKNKYSIEIIEENKSRRFGSDIAKFSNLVYPGDPVIGIMDEQCDASGVFQISKKDIDKYLLLFEASVLRFNKRTDTMGYQAYNFGVSKGMTIDRVVIFPNGPLKQFLKAPTMDLSNKEKYYVGTTRAKYSMTFVVDKLVENEFFKHYEIESNNERFSVLKFIC